MWPCACKRFEAWEGERHGGSWAGGPAASGLSPPKAPAWANNLAGDPSRPASFPQVARGNPAKRWPCALRHLWQLSEIPLLCLGAGTVRVWMWLWERFFGKGWFSPQMSAAALSANCSPVDAWRAETTPPQSKGKTCPKLDFSSRASFPFPVTLALCTANSLPPHPDIPPLFSLTLKEFITEECKKITAKSFCVTGKSLQH